MSVISNSLRTRFAGLLRELLRRFDENGSGAMVTPQSPRRAAPATPPLTTVVPVQPPAPFVQPSVQQSAAPAAPKPVAAPASLPKPPQVENTTDLEMPLQSVLETLPLELRSKMSVKNVDLSRASISIALKKIQPQLSLGIVRITFGELRRAAPSLFSVQDEYDSLPVVLPLSKVLARLSPSLLTRNSTQKTVEVPAEITGPFGEHGQGIAISATPVKSPTPSTAPPAQMAAPMTTAPAQLRPTPVVPPPPPVMLRQITPTPSIVFAPHSSNEALPKPVIPTVPVRPITPPLPVAPVVLVAPMPMPTPMPVVSAQTATMVLLAALSEKWPEALRLEIAPLISANAQVALPVNLMEPALKRGRVTFTWGNLRLWIKPTPPATSVHDAVELELPLRAVVPHFLARQSGAVKMARSQQTVPMPVDIPNLFFGFPQPQPAMPSTPPQATTPQQPLAMPSTPPQATTLQPPLAIPSTPPQATTLQPPLAMPSTPPQATPPQSPPVEENRPAPKPVETRQPATNYYTWFRPEPPQVEMPASKIEHERPVTPAIAVDFGDHCITPKEVVSRAAALNGVAGVVVALPDGLMVASQVPPDFSADTLAAFLPQIFDRVNQSAKELRMGALDNLNFTVGGVPWKIFRVNAVYFAAFGRAGGQLPDVQLAALAAELDLKKQ